MKLNEYTVKPELSARARTFVDSYAGEIVPEDIKAEIIKYVKDITPLIDKGNTDMIKDFEQVFKK